MRKSLGCAMAALLASTTPLSAQQVSKDGASGNVGVAAAKAQFDGFSGWATTVATQVSEADYGYRPVSTVRSIGELIGHLANANYMFCAIALGEKSPSTTNIEKTVTSKDGLVAAIKAANSYCGRAYAMSDADASARVNLFGQTVTKLHALTMNAAHNAEHYGNLVTYMRMKGMVPPSSQ